MVAEKPRISTVTIRNRINFVVRWSLAFLIRDIETVLRNLSICPLVQSVRGFGEVVLETLFEVREAVDQDRLIQSGRSVILC